MRARFLPVAASLPVTIWGGEVGMMSGGALVADYATGGFYDEMFAREGEGVTPRPH